MPPTQRTCSTATRDLIRTPPPPIPPRLTCGMRHATHAPRENLLALWCRPTPEFASERPAEGFLTPAEACVLSARTPHARSGLNGLHRPMRKKWRERYRWHRRAIGGTYQGSLGQMSEEGVEDGSAPLLVTHLPSHEICAGFESRGQI